MSSSKPTADCSKLTLPNLDALAHCFHPAYLRHGNRLRLAKLPQASLSLAMGYRLTLSVRCTSSATLSVAVKENLQYAMLSSLRAPGALWAALRPELRREASSQCSDGRHVVPLPGLRLQTPTRKDSAMILASASDAEAQRWLGWQPQHVVRDGYREEIMVGRPGRGRVLPQPNENGQWDLIAVHPEGGQLAGSACCNERTGEIGGVLAPWSRGLGLGFILFAGAAQFAHHHLGIRSITAGTEPGNAACIASLTSAGYTRVPGPPTHTLPNGRVVPAAWFRHEAARPSRCPIWQGR